jgi:hypothetical protein
MKNSLAVEGPLGQEALDPAAIARFVLARQEW